MPEEFQVLVKKFDKIDTRRTGDVLLELRFADIIIKFANLTEEPISSNLGFLVIFLYPGHESLPRQSHEGYIHDLMESNTTIIPAPLFDRFVLFGEQRIFYPTIHLISESDPLQVCRFSRFVLFGEWKMLFTTRQVEFRFVRFDEWKILCSI